MNKELTPEVPAYWTFGGEPMKVEIVDEVTFKFITAAPAPGMIPWLARYLDAAGFPQTLHGIQASEVQPCHQ